MDYGWRFHLGDASDITRDFGLGASRTFAKTGSGWDDVTFGVYVLSRNEINMICLPINCSFYMRRTELKKVELFGYFGLKA